VIFLEYAADVAQACRERGLRTVAVTAGYIPEQAREIALKNGLRYVYTGNVHDLAGSSTYCPECGTVLIGRDWYELSTWNLSMREGKAVCASCLSAIPGAFEEKPGAWGSRRRPIRIAAA
jgi:pyruvate formate lyase activating enzyme